MQKLREFRTLFGHFIWREEVCVSFFTDFPDPDAVNNGPNPANEDSREEELSNAVNEGHSVEFFAEASRDAGSNARGEGDDVENQHNQGDCCVELDDGVSAALAAGFDFLFSHNLN